MKNYHNLTVHAADIRAILAVWSVSAQQQYLSLYHVVRGPAYKSNNNIVILPKETVCQLVAATYTLTVKKIIHLTAGAKDALRHLERITPDNRDPKNTFVSESGRELPPNPTPNAQPKITTDTPALPNQNFDSAPPKPTSKTQKHPEPICVTLRLSTIRGLLTDFDRLPDNFFAFPAYRNHDRQLISNLLGQATKQNDLAKLSRDQVKLLCEHLHKLIDRQKLFASELSTPTIIMVHAVLTKHLKTL